MLRIGTVILLAMSGMSAATVAGTWSGGVEQKTNDGRTGRMSMLVELKQDGDRVSGTAGPDNSNQAPIQDARLDGQHLTFSVTLPPPPGSDAGPTWKFDLTVSGNRMEGRSEGTMGARSLGITQVVLTRQK
jgi:hypothetical protein